MLLAGSCHCGAVRFTVEAYAPVPYMRCYCSVCRKTAGGGGYAINLGAKAKTLKVEGEKNLSAYQARGVGHGTRESEPSPARRNFCKTCGAALFVIDPRWPDYVHPFASAIDTPLPPAPTHEHIMLDFKASWVPLEMSASDQGFPEYPELSLEDWHRAHGCLSE